MSKKPSLPLCAWKGISNWGLLPCASKVKTTDPTVPPYCHKHLELIAIIAATAPSVTQINRRPDSGLVISTR